MSIIDKVFIDQERCIKCLRRQKVCLRGAIREKVPSVKELRGNYKELKEDVRLYRGIRRKKKIDIMQTGSLPTIVTSRLRAEAKMRLYESHIILTGRRFLVPNI